MKQKLVALLTSVLFLLAVFPTGAVVSADTAGTTDNGLKYTIADGVATITGYETKPTGQLIIPFEIEGCPVRAIEAWALADCNKITAVILPDSITEIGNYAFHRCYALTSVVLPSNVVSIGYGSFSYCIELSNISVIPESTTYIGEGAFSSTALEEIAVNDSNTAYCSVDGVLFNKEKTILYQYPSGRSGEYTIPNGVTRIANLAFAGSENLTAVHFPHSVTSIGEDAFLWCSSLRDLILSGNLETIDDGAFSYCVSITTLFIPLSVTSIGNWVFADDGNSLTDIYYEGTEMDRQTIHIGEWGNNPLLSATWHYNYKPEPTAAPGDINEDGKVNIRDLGLLQQYLNGWDVTVDASVADINHDEKVNIRDLGLLQQHLNGWNVEGL